MIARTPTEREDGFAIRPMQPADRAEVQRLLRNGLLPGHVDYEAERAPRLERLPASRRERFLVAEADGRVIGTIALVEARPEVGHLHWLRVAPQWQSDLRVAEALVKAAAAHAQEVGILKLAMHAPVEVEATVTAYYDKLGFIFSRKRQVDNLHVLEFYQNLYEKPETRDES